MRRHFAASVRSVALHASILWLLPGMTRADTAVVEQLAPPLVDRLGTILMAATERQRIATLIFKVPPAESHAVTESMREQLIADVRERLLASVGLKFYIGLTNEGFYQDVLDRGLDLRDVMGDVATRRRLIEELGVGILVVVTIGEKTRVAIVSRDPPAESGFELEGGGT